MVQHSGNMEGEVGDGSGNFDIVLDAVRLHLVTKSMVVVDTVSHKANLYHLTSIFTPTLSLLCSAGV